MSKCVEKEMTIHSSVLTWKTSWTEEPAGCGPWDYRVRHDWATEQQQQKRLKVLLSSSVSLHGLFNFSLLFCKCRLSAQIIFIV